MRRIFLILVAVNIGILLWTLQKQHHEDEPDLALEAGVGNLRLLAQVEKMPAMTPPPSEQRGGQELSTIPETGQRVSAPGTSAADDAQAGGSPASVEAPVSNQLLDDPPEHGIQQQEAPSGKLEAVPMMHIAAASAEINATHQASADDPSVGPGTVVGGGDASSVLPGDSDPDMEKPAADKLLETEKRKTSAMVEIEYDGAEVLVSKTIGGNDPGASVGVSSVSEVDDAVPATQESYGVEVASPAESCGVFGPVEDEALSQAIANILENKDMEVSIRIDTEERVQGYWVMIPPLNTRREAVEVVRRLEAEGVTDVMRFFKGEMRNAISLGMYNRRRNAENRRRSIASKGFAAEVRARTRETQLRSIDYRAKGESAGQVIRDIRIQYPELGHREQPCR